MVHSVNDEYNTNCGDEFQQYDPSVADGLLHICNDRTVVTTTGANLREITN